MKLAISTDNYVLKNSEGYAGVAGERGTNAFVQIGQNIPTVFFNPVQHLLIHLPYEAKVGGPNKLRATVGNKAIVEGCIMEQFKLKEVAHKLLLCRRT
jgi:hypothetical protein